MTRHTVDWEDPALIARFGVESDVSIAASLGLSSERVRQVRTRLGISRQRSFTDEVRAQILDLAGSAPDTEVAARLGVDHSTVRYVRHRAGIAAYVLVGPIAIEHGTRTAYCHHCCRCDRCRRVQADHIAGWARANPERWAQIQNRQREKVLASAPHSKRSAKVAWYVLGCRCDGCKHANSRSQKRRHQSGAQEGTV